MCVFAVLKNIKQTKWSMISVHNLSTEPLKKKMDNWRIWLETAAD